MRAPSQKESSQQATRASGDTIPTLHRRMPAFLFIDLECAISVWTFLPEKPGTGLERSIMDAALRNWL
jgi:hypothetical protein